MTEAPPGAATALDDAQLAAIDAALRGNAGVVGAPGSGKTTTVIELVARLLAEPGAAADGVVVVAASRRGATDLRDRLALRAGVPTTGPLARTLSSLAHGIVQRAAALAGEPAPRLLTGSEQDSILAELIAGHEETGGGPAWPEPIDADVVRMAGFRTELRELMMRATESGAGPRELAALGAEAGRPEWQAAAVLIAEYERVVDAFPDRMLDSSELVAEAVRVVRSGSVAPPWRVVVVDDLHEQGSGALALLRALAAAGVRIVAFGDPDVAAATFRGSDPGAVTRLASVIGAPAAQLRLGAVHRHGVVLRDLVREASGRVGASGSVEHRAAASEHAVPGEARVLQEPTSARLYRRVARILREHHLLRGVPWSRMAVVARSGASLAPIERALAIDDVPVLGGRAVQAPAAVQTSAALLTAAGLALGRLDWEPARVEDLLVGPLGGLDRIALRRLRLALRHDELAAGGTTQADELLVDAIRAPGGLEAAPGRPARRAARLQRSLHEAAALAAEGGSVEELLWGLWERSGLAARLVEQAAGSGLAADDADRQLDGVMALFTAAKRAVERDPDAPPGAFVDEQLAAQIREDSLTPVSAADRVWLGTPNGLVGAEVDVVVVLGLQDGAWPNPQLRGSLLAPQEFSARRLGLPVGDLDTRAEVVSDELRLFVLSVSRARTHLVLGAVASDDEQPSPFLRFPSLPAPEPAEDPSAFTLRGLVGELRRHATGADPGIAADAADALARLAAEGVDGADPSQWHGIAEPSTTAPLTDLTQPDAAVRVSPSRIEAFEASPLVWFVERVAPAPSALPSAIGTIVHRALEVAGASDEPEGRSEAALWRTIDEGWPELRFEAPWLGEQQRRRVGQLVAGVAAYLAEAERDGWELVGSELALAADLGPARLRGQADRVERGRGGAIRIVDLKTGRTPPPRAAVADNAQLGAYQAAARAGGIDGVDADADIGGGALLFAGKSSRGGRPFTLLVQEPPEDGGEAFEARLRLVAEGMAAASFEADLDPAPFAVGSGSGWAARIHIAGSVSADPGGPIAPSGAAGADADEPGDQDTTRGPTDD